MVRRDTPRGGISANSVKVGGASSVVIHQLHLTSNANRHNGCSKELLLHASNTNKLKYHPSPPLSLSAHAVGNRVTPAPDKVMVSPEAEPHSLYFLKSARPDPVATDLGAVTA